MIGVHFQPLCIMYHVYSIRRYAHDSGVVIKISPVLCVPIVSLPI